MDGGLVVIDGSLVVVDGGLVLLNVDFEVMDGGLVLLSEFLFDQCLVFIFLLQGLF